MATKKKSFAPKKTLNDHHQNVANELIEKIKSGTAPWQKPWEPGQVGGSPQNAVTGKEYRGGNRLWLEMQQPGNDPRWCTYKQAQSVNAQVRKGEKGTTIVHWKFDKEQVKRDVNGKPVKDSTGKTIKEKVALERPIALMATVFHASQIDGLPEWQSSEKNDDKSKFERHERCETILANSGANITHENGDRAFYRPSSDAIVLPEKEQFHSPDGYYATALHELGHWTGHPSRLDRDLAHPFGSEGYAKEELRAEISSLMIARELGVGHDPEQHASYVGSWLKVIENDPAEVYRAAKDADAITNYVMEFEHSKEHEVTETVDKEQSQPVIEEPDFEIGE